jgi:hypothetical protein
MSVTSRIPVSFYRRNRLDSLLSKLPSMHYAAGMM